MIRYLFLSLFCFSLCACGGGTSDAIRFGLDTATGTLDPRFATDAAGTRQLRLMFRQLIDFDESDSVVPSLARWETIDPRRVRFFLGTEGRLFHDCSRLTAHDVKATFEVILVVQLGSPLRAGLDVIEHIEVVDDETVEFHLNKPDEFFINRLGIGIMKAWDAAGKTPYTPLGSGPFAFVKRIHEGRIVIERVRDGQRFEFITVQDPMVRVLKLLRGELDMVQNGLAPEWIDFVKRRPQLRFLAREGSDFSYVGLNMRDPVLQQIEVRKAIAHAIDRDAILNKIWLEYARTANGLLPPAHWAGHSGLAPYAFDPELSKRLLAAVRPRLVERVGHGGKIPLIYKASSNPFRLRLASVLQQQLNDVGFDVQMRSYEWATFYADIGTGHFQLYSLTWVAVKSPDMFKQIFHSASVPPNGYNRGWYASGDTDALITQAMRGKDRAATWRFSACSGTVAAESSVHSVMV